MKTNIILSSFVLLSTFNSIGQINGISGLSESVKQPSGINTICDTTFSFHLRDTWPCGIVWDGAAFWSGGSDFTYIHKYTPQGAITDSILNPSSTDGIQGLTFDGKHLWALAEGEDIIYKLDTGSGAVLKQFYVPLYMNGFGLAFDGNFLWATEYFNGILAKVDTANGVFTNTIAPQAQLIDLTVINGELFGITTKFNYLYKIDKLTGAFTDSISWCIPYPLGITWDGTHLWNVSSKTSYGGKQRAFKIDINSIITGISHIPDSENILIYPNPFALSTTIQMNRELINATLFVFNNSGQLVKKFNDVFGNSIVLNRGQLAPGFYQIQVNEVGKCIAREKLVITD